MQKLIRLSFLIMFLAAASSCGDTSKKEGSLKDKKADLEKLKTDKSKLDDKITALEKEIAKLDTSAGAQQKPKLVSITPIANQEFKHYLLLQGTVDNKSVSYITPTGQGGQIKAIYVKQGDNIKKGQLVLKLDNDLASQGLDAAKQQLGGIQTQLDLAKSVYQRQKNLWDQHIGTEVQLLQDKTNVETLEKQLNAAQAQVQQAQTQLNYRDVYSDVNGVINNITAHVGDYFGGGSIGAYIEVINQANMKITVIVPENYAGKVNKGTPVIVQIPDVNKSFKGTIDFMSEAIGANNRGLTAEIKVPAGMDLRPNQIAVVKIIDYSVPSTVVINVNALQTDEEGKFVLVATKEGDKLIARKRKVSIGETSGDEVEIKQGLQTGDQLITEGYQALFDGQLITTTGA